MQPLKTGGELLQAKISAQCPRWSERPTASWPKLAEQWRELEQLAAGKDESRETYDSAGGFAVAYDFVADTLQRSLTDLP